MKKVVRLTESELVKMIKNVLNEQNQSSDNQIVECIKKSKIRNPNLVPQSCMVILKEVYEKQKFYTETPDQGHKLYNCLKELSKNLKTETNLAWSEMTSIFKCLMKPRSLF